MKTSYKGYEIRVVRERCLAGYSLIYYDVFRDVDGLHVIGDFTESEDTIRTITKDLKQRVDEFIETKGESEDLSEEYEIVSED